MSAIDAGPSSQLPARNGLGLAGFIVSLVGVFCTCTILSPIGLLLSVIALFKPPRGFAIAGTVIGLAGTVILALASSFVWVVVQNVPNSGFGQIVPILNTMMSAAAAVTDLANASPGAVPSQEAGSEIAARHKDAWGTPFRYEPGDHVFHVVSAGSDKQFDTPDDLKLDNDVKSQGR